MKPTLERGLAHRFVYKVPEKNASLARQLAAGEWEKGLMLAPRTIRHSPFAIHVPS